jgi:hypothetical protein
MGYSFTEEQLARIQTAFDRADAGGSWAAVYELVASIFADEPDASGSTPIKSDPEVQASRLWLLGAAQANAGEGAFSTLIRDYTARQYELHFGVTLSDELAQEASDAVARRVLRQILNAGELPTVDEIADQDATAVGSVLFDTTPSGADYADTAASDRSNAAWSGSILFSFFDHGTVAADQTDRLLATGASEQRQDRRPPCTV